MPDCVENFRAHFKKHMVYKCAGKKCSNEKELVCEWEPTVSGTKGWSIDIEWVNLDS